MTKQEYAAYRQSEVWRTIRRRKLEAQGYCSDCYLKNELVVHHLIYDRIGGAERMEDLEVLCRRCHNDRHIDKLLPAYAPISKDYKIKIALRQKKLREWAEEEELAKEERERRELDYM